MGRRIMVANALFVTIAVAQGHLFWLMGELIFFASYKGLLFHAYGNIVLGGYGFTKPRKARHRVLAQRELTAEILSL
jgi:hypothetical protein